MAKSKRKREDLQDEDTSGLNNAKGLVHSYSSNSYSSRRTVWAKAIIDECVKESVSNPQKKFRNGIKHVIHVDVELKTKFQQHIFENQNADKKVFFSAKRDPSNNADLPPNCVWESLFERDFIDLVDTTEGLICFDKGSKDPVFVLLPRNKQTLGCRDPHLFLEALKHVESQKGKKTTVRGIKREVVYEKNTVDANYVSTGVAANRGGRGLYQKDVNSEVCDRHLKRMTRFIEHQCDRYLDKKVKNALQKVIEKIDYDVHNIETLKKQKTETTEDGEIREIATKLKCNERPPFFPSMATGRNTTLQIHTDEDAFFSVVCIYRENDVGVKLSNQKGRRSIKRSYLKEESDVLKYFTFSTGLTVALRSGDILMFNPQIEHCISSNTDVCKEDDVFCTSHYFKSMVLGLNNNNIKFEE